MAAALGAGGAAVVAMRWPSRDPGGPGGGGRPEGPPPVRVSEGPGRLLARVSPADAVTPEPGLHALGLASGRDGLLFVPSAARPGVPAPLVVALHGAGGDARGGIAPLRDLAEGAGLVVVAPESRGTTWDVIQGGFGPDVAFVDRALESTFGRVTVDTGRLAIAGFSDGASYALSLGLANADLFTHCIAFSPGFVSAPARRGRFRVFITHGVKDAVLPIDRCSRRIVPVLRRDGYEVDYREFDGGHVVPPDLASAAVDWLAAP